MGLMALGVALLLRGRHEHEHAREELQHERVHTHDAHHPREHRADDPPGEPHRHAPVAQGPWKERGAGRLPCGRLRYEVMSCSSF